MNMQAPPTCDICGAVKSWVAPGVSRNTSIPYDGFWGCPNRKNHPKGVSAGYPKPFTPQAPPAAQAAPGEANGHSVAPAARERSIAAQACAKAACDAFAGAGIQGSSPEAQHDWIINLARALYRGVVADAVAGNLDPQPLDSDINF